MQIVTANKADLDIIKKLWTEIFGDSEKFADFAVNICPSDEIYLVKENDKIAAWLVAGIDLFAGNKKGFYIYGLATVSEHRGKGYAKSLVNYVVDKKLSGNYDFALTKPADKGLFGFYRKLGFDGTTYLRVGEIDIKRNIWTTASYDAVTATKFKDVRDGYSEDTVVHFSKQGYEKFTEYVYTEGGSTAESKNAYCLYYEEGDKLVVRELFATDTQYALQLLQAVRERTGRERAVIQLSRNSTLFLGEGKLIPYSVTKGIDKEIYANLMFD